MLRSPANVAGAEVTRVATPDLPPRWPARALLALAVAAYVFFLAWYNSPYAGGSDSSGYLNSAKLLLAGRLTTTPRIPDTFPVDVFSRDAFVPAAFTTGQEPGSITPTYPLGLPLHLAGIATLTGLAAAPVVLNILTALAVLVLTYATARDFGVTRRTGAAITLLLALSPLFLLYALQPMSDLLATVWTLAAVLCAWRTTRHWAWGFGAGLATAIAVFVRPTSALLIFPLVACLGFNLRAWLACAIIGAPAAVLWAALNHRLFGGAFRTGYGAITDALQLGYVPPTLWHFAKWLCVVLTPFAAAALGLPFTRTSARAKRVLLAWAGALVLFYSAYSFSHETWWYLRFLLPAMPALLIAAALVWQERPLVTISLALEGSIATRRADPAPRHFALRLPHLAFLAAVAWQLAWAWHFQVHKLEPGERAYRDVARWVSTALPEPALLVAGQTTGALFHYTDRAFLQWAAVSAENYPALNRYLAARGDSLYAALFSYEEQAALVTHLPGTWERVARFRDISVWRRLDSTPAPLPN